MRTYLVTYDLHKDRDYRSVIKILEEHGAVRLMESTWVVRHPAGGSLLDALKKAGDADDSFFIIELQKELPWVGENLNDDGRAFLEKHVRKSASRGWPAEQ